MHLVKIFAPVPSHTNVMAHMYPQTKNELSTSSLSKVDKHRLTDTEHTQRRLGVVVSVVGRINEVNQHLARLVHDG